MHHGHALGGPGRLGQEELVQQRLARALAVRPVEPHQELLALRLAEQRQLRQAPLRPGRDPFEQTAEMVQQPRGRRGVEELGAVPQRQRQTAVELGRHQRQVEVGRRRLQGERL
jgi:hypothetical protein